MDYKSQSSLPTSIHTRINDKLRISSIWRTFANENFESQSWETFLWDGDNIKETYNTLKNADNVVDLHFAILNECRNKNYTKD